MARVRLLGLVLLLASLLPAFILYTRPWPEGSALAFFADPLTGLWSYVGWDPMPRGSIVARGLPGDVLVVYDSHGVPYIFASNERAAFYAFGYLQACSRLWQMDVLRRLAEGRLSELLGEPAYQLDRYMVVIGLPRAAEESLELVKSLADNGDSNAMAALDAINMFSRGVNECVERMLESGRLPLEYRLLGLEPEPWRPLDTFAVAKLLDYMLAYSSDDLAWGLLAAGNRSYILALHMDYARWLHENGVEIIHDPGEALETGRRLGLPEAWAGNPPLALPGNATVANWTLRLEGLREALAAQLRLEARARLEASTLLPLATGFSNNWLVSGRATGTGKPLLANDPHLKLTAPPIWFEARIHAPGGLDAYGVTLPGLPFILIGRTPTVAFGYTNSFVDVTDYYFYLWRGGRYLYRGQWLEPRWGNETILVRTPQGGLERRTVRVGETVHGRLVEARLGNHTYRLAVRSTVLMPSPAAVWAYLANHARTLRDFIMAQRYFYGPIQNTVVATSGGETAYLPVGLVPVRTSLPRVVVEAPNGSMELVNTGFLPFNGSRGEGEWKGFIPFNMLPRLVGVKSFLATANNMISIMFTGNPRYYLQWGFMDGYRWRRITSLLNQTLKTKGAITVEDAARVQLDTTSLAAREVLTPLIPALRRAAANETEKRAVQALAAWLHNPVMSPGRAEPSIAYTLLHRLHRLVWEGAAREAGLPLDTWEIAGHVARLEYVEYMLKTGRGRWYLEKLTNGKTVEELSAESLHETVGLLTRLYGAGSPEEWRWGKIHVVEAKHVLGDRLGWLNLGPAPAPGGPYTVNVAPMLRPGEPVTVGPSTRLVTSLASQGGIIVLPGGESGAPLSPLYRDQFTDWLRGRYHAFTLAEDSSKVPGATATLEMKGPRSR